MEKLSLSLVTKADLANRFGISEWLYPSYLTLALREAPLSEEEIGRLGIPFTAKLSLIRESIIKDRFARGMTDLLRSAKDAIEKVTGLRSDVTESPLPAENIGSPVKESATAIGDCECFHVLESNIDEQ